LQIYGFVKVMRRRFVTTSGILRGGRDTGTLGSGSLCAADGILLRDVFFACFGAGCTVAMTLFTTSLGSGQFRLSE
jgi:hypothetical protein